jgi:uncharacterized protein YndB with AHSA1/START domain
MSVDVLTEIEIARSRAEVAAFASDPSNATRWYRNIRSVTWETTPPLAVGSRVRFRARFLGRTLEYTYEIQEFEPAQRLVMAMSDGPFAMETTYTWADADAGTRMTLRNRGEPEGYMRMLGVVVEAGMRRANRGDLARLKDIVEKGTA